MIIVSLIKRCIGVLNKQTNIYSDHVQKRIEDLVKCSYDKLSVKCTAKATDVQSVYSVKSTSRNGVRGYLIVGKI